jgi:hypothetical protein
MASITKTASGWRAQIYCKGVRSSSSFKRRQDAVTWATSEEDRLRNGIAGAGRARRKNTATTEEMFADVAPLLSPAELI